MSRIRKASTIVFDNITLEGGLISPAMLEKVVARQASDQTEEDYFVPKGLTVRDEMPRYFRIGQALWADFAAVDKPSTAHTISFIEKLLKDVFGFPDLARTGTRTLEGHTYPVTLEALGGRIPVIVVPPEDGLDRASIHLPTEGRRRSASTAVQDWLNADNASLWGFCTNGEKIRLVRDNASLTRPAYIEADLKQIFANGHYNDFAALWLLIHISRFGRIGTPVSDCALEKWREAGSKEGVAARDRLRDGVEQAILVLGNGFIRHAKNSDLRQRLQQDHQFLPDYFSQLLRLVYRFIFLMVTEDRNLLHDPQAAAKTKQLYMDGYSISHLRQLAVRRNAWDKHHDKWEGLRILFRSLADGQPLLGLPALGGLFTPDNLPDLEVANLDNRSLLEAIYKLAWLKDDNRLTPVNWRDMETEELGSVYESLLELTPRLNGDGLTFKFAEGVETRGNSRKTTGSYYTPDSLVQALLDSALDPVLEKIEAESENPAEALLSVSAIDPACGSGHFLLAAARRIAGRIARLRAGGVASAEDYRHALRDAVRNCIYGVDRNPMAVELTKVALWIETVEPGKPLGFLDANIRCGDALLGVFDLEMLRKGIPEAAYKPLSGDDRETANYFKRKNLADTGGEGRLDFGQGTGAGMPPTPPLENFSLALRNLPEDNVEQIKSKKQKYQQAQKAEKIQAWREAADAYVAAFLTPKIGGITNPTIPTTAHVWARLSGQLMPEAVVQTVRPIATQARIFHWQLEFADIFAKGGFDVVLGNPPWERIKLQEQEFFASRDGEIAEAPNAAARRRLIEKLKDAPTGTRNHNLYLEFEMAKRLAEASSIYVRESGRYPLSGRGDVNTYALFAEHFRNMTSSRGRSGMIVPTNIATDATTAPFFSALVKEKRLVQLIDFENREKIFLSIDSRIKFCLLTLGHSVPLAKFSFFLTNTSQLHEAERLFTLTPEQIATINPNTLTAPVFRSKKDAELTAKIYSQVPILIKEDDRSGNPWNLSFMAMFHMSNDSSLFQTAPGDELVPLYEAKMIHQFDHRWATYERADEEDGSRDCTLAEKQNPNFEPRPRYWVPEDEVDTRLLAKNWTRGWLMGVRGIARATDERTIIAGILPYSGVGHSANLWLPSTSPQLLSCMYANFISIVVDYISRQKIGGVNLSGFIVQQFPVLPPNAYSDSEVRYIVQRVLELTYTSKAMAPFAHDLGYDGPPFTWDEDRRALLRAELDAWYARAYGLARDELRYILDPADVMGPDYPSETFRVLKDKEMKLYGEYRTRRLVLEAWDRLEAERAAA